RITETATAGGYSGLEFYGRDGTAGNFGGAIFRAQDSDDISIWTGDNVSSPKVTVEYDTGNVGIGTADPSQKLDVTHGADGVVDGLKIGATGDSYPGIFFGRTAGSAWTNRAWLFTLGTDGAYILQDETANKNRFAITTDGDFHFSEAYLAAGSDDIMTITNSSRLVKIGKGADNPSLSAGTSLYVTRDGNTNAVIRNSTDDVEIGFGAWTVAFFGTRTNDDIYFQTNALNRMVLDASGNLGIGTDGPDGKLEVNMGTSGEVRLSYNDADGSATDYTKFEVGSDGEYTITTVDSDGAAGHVALMPDGNVGIGTTDPAQALHVVGGFSNTPDEITATDGGVAASIATINTEVTTNGDSDLDNVTLANGTSGQIKHIYCVVEGNAGDTWKITPATMCGGTQITFATVGEGCTLVYADSEGWVVVANNGGTIS
ncbi:MAG: hypothetical protein JSV93_04185, partial [Candidatus Omnitrophota bacterium]